MRFYCINRMGEFLFIVAKLYDNKNINSKGLCINEI